MTSTIWRQFHSSSSEIFWNKYSRKAQGDDGVFVSAGMGGRGREVRRTLLTTSSDLVREGREKIAESGVLDK